MNALIDKLAQKSPVSVMARILLERVFAPQKIDNWPPSLRWGLSTFCPFGTSCSLLFSIRAKIQYNYFPKTLPIFSKRSEIQLKCYGYSSHHFISPFATSAFFRALAPK